MIEFFKIKNMSTLQELSFGQDVNCDFVFGSGDVDWGTVSANHSTYSYPGQAGTYISSTSLSERIAYIAGYVYYVLSDIERKELKKEDRVSYCYKKILQKKRELSALINPENYARIIIGKYYLEGKPESSVRFGNTEEDNNLYFCRFFFSLYCNYPMFRQNTETQVVLAGISPSFHFPLIFPKGRGIVMSIKRSYQLVPIENIGDVSIGALITLRAKGVVQKPTIENIFTNERIVVNKTLEAGEVVKINTNDGMTKGIVGIKKDVEFNYLKYWNFDNSWLKFEPGITLIGYSTENASEALLDVTVDINPSFYNLEEV